MTGRNIRLWLPTLLLGSLLWGCSCPPVSKAQTPSSGFDEGLAQTLQSILFQERSRLQLTGVSAAVLVPGQGLMNYSG